MFRMLRKLDRVVKLLESIMEKEDAMSAAMDALKAQVAQTISLESQAITDIQNLNAGKEDTAGLTNLTSQLQASSAALQAAISPPAPVAPAAPAAPAAPVATPPAS